MNTGVSGESFPGHFLSYLLIFYLLPVYLLTMSTPASLMAGILALIPANRPAFY